MPELTFVVTSAEPVRASATPLMGFQVSVTDTAAERVPIHTIILRCQVRILPARRRYNSEEQEHLVDLFGTPDRWGKTVREMLWANVTATVPQFQGETSVEIQAPCSFDFALAATKYFDALKSGEIPLSFLFSGTIFYDDDGANGLRVTQIPWDREATYRMPLAAWQVLENMHYANTAWIGLRKDIFDRLNQLKSRGGHSNWEQTLEALLPREEAHTA